MRKIQPVLAQYLESNTRISQPSTVDNYHIVFRQWQQLFGPRLWSLTDDNLVAFMRWLGDGRSAATVNHKAGYVRAFWRWCCKRGYLKRWPTVRNVPEPELIPTAWTQPQLAQLFTAARCQVGFVGGVPAGRWWHSIHVWWYYTGERLSATLAARWDHYDGETLAIPGGVRKAHKAMIYEMTPQLRAAIESISKPARELIWPWPLHLTSFYYHYQRLLKSAGLPRVPWKSGPQKMRRSYASWLEASGGDATVGLRHSARSVTEASYLDPRIVRRPNQSVLLPRVG